nr:AT-rich interactive domain-containing protein 6-like isoform X1 [Ipomoea trifida]GMC48539.1 AT-rich interactive domain-containing protein 6-like isoform X1 [Ipomoea batatas]
MTDDKAEDKQEIAQDAPDAVTDIHAANNVLAENKDVVDNKTLSNLSHIDATEFPNKIISSSEDANTCMESENPEIFHPDAKSGEVPTIEGKGFIQPHCHSDDKIATYTTDIDPCDRPDYMGKDSSSQVSEEDEMSEELKNSVSGVELSSGNGTAVRGLIDELPRDGPVPKESSTVNGSREDEVKSEAKKELLPTEEAKQEYADALNAKEVLPTSQVNTGLPKPDMDVGHDSNMNLTPKSFLLDTNAVGVDESGTEEEQAAFMKELETFHKERCLEFKPPRFYGEPLNCLKLWRAVIRLGGYEQVTSCKLWRQVGESFKPPKTCTTVSWTFRCFYEKALLEYEKYKMRSGELPFADASFSEPSSTGNPGNQASGSGRARRDAAARAMQGWHSQRLLGNGEVGDPIIKDKNPISTPKREKQLKSIGLLKRKKLSPVDNVAKATRLKIPKIQSESMVADIGAPADWVKINVQRTNDCFEVYALVPGLLREEVRVQSDPAGRLVISGQPEQLDNPWGVTPFKKVVSLPSRIDPHQTSAVVTLHGQLFVRVPFEQSDI